MKATDKGSPSLSTFKCLEITALDQNEFGPVFNPSTIRVSIQESAQIGLFVAHPRATDQDNDDSDHMVPPTLQMCSKHKPGHMIEVCKVCSAALTMVRPEVAKQLIAPGSIVAPSVGKGLNEILI